MLNLRDIWIGEQLRLKLSGRIGTFEGLNKKGKARVKIDDKIILSTAENLEIYVEAKKTIKLNNLDISEQTISTSFSPTIDLHINILNPELSFANPVQIVNFQIRKCKEFVEEAQKRRISEVLIIHGKGTGELKLEVVNMVKQSPSFYQAESTNDGGALKVKFNYY